MRTRFEAGQETIDEYADGSTIVELAEKCGVAYGTLRGALVRAGVKLRRPGSNRNRMPPSYLPTPEEIARAAEVIRARWSDRTRRRRSRRNLLEKIGYAPDEV